ncbi:uncharacterized protein P174DRAFT_457082 [Aspergillus novofumigatus IBT 16806]|uniref:BTB domain-containing protein n=1 Tax=Aspergillus novofumigatus (strain IBT 16806) TaxID=1392255 RepID=A0A2I1CF90_ASPN1|nr:uncharacterized protein P174DRAFT_457082 [Aspergillus novofumigatus IBT 16806]PKX96270.1 hypothetical protein P174DRAFT_457082 [Aspergillus novofumigatus IBT 16806]
MPRPRSSLSHGDVQKNDSGDNPTLEAIHKKFMKKRLKKKNKKGHQTPVQPEMDESTNNPAETPEPADIAMQSATEIVDERAQPDAALDGLIENRCGIDSEVALQEPEHDEYMGGDCFCIQVSVKHLTLASPIFKKTLSGCWKEGLHLLNEGSDLKVFLILMDIFHCQAQNLPREICLELLAKIAVLADCYQCQTLVRFFAEIWIGHLRRKIFPMIYSCDSMLWVWFEKSTSIAISQSNSLITSLDLLIPAKVIDEMNRRRIDVISAVLSSLMEQRDSFLDGSRGCCFECSSIMLGALMKHMHSSGLLFLEPAAPFPGLSYCQLLETVCGFRSPQWHSNSGYLRYSWHNCGVASFSSLIAAPGTSIKGLSLIDFLVL